MSNMRKGLKSVIQQGVPSPRRRALPPSLPEFECTNGDTRVTREARFLIRRGEYAGPTAQFAPGVLQANMVVVEQQFAFDFLSFALANPKPCPLLDIVEPHPTSGVYESRLAQGSDLRTDIPLYRVWQHGRIMHEVPDATPFWPKNGIAFLLGCSFSFEAELKQLSLLRKSTASVPMYRTTVPNKRGGIFQGKLVVSMRLIEPENVAAVTEITEQHPLAHGAPVAIGVEGQRELGIRDLGRPDFGEKPQLEEGLIPVFWPCGVTPQTAIEDAANKMGNVYTITHSPGCMFITDIYW